jgi:hypothetical protein
VRLRTLTEAECYARCYGGRREETVSILRFGFDEDIAERRSDSYEPAAGSEPAEGREAREAA